MPYPQCSRCRRASATENTAWPDPLQCWCALAEGDTTTLAKSQVPTEVWRSWLKLGPKTDEHASPLVDCHACAMWLVHSRAREARIPWQRIGQSASPTDGFVLVCDGRPDDDGWANVSSHHANALAGLQEPQAELAPEVWWCRFNPADLDDDCGF